MLSKFLLGCFSRAGALGTAIPAHWRYFLSKAARYLAAWTMTTRAARWGSLAELRRVDPNADLVAVASGKRVVVFNVCGNTYRLIVAIHFDRQLAYTLRFLTHAEYSKDRWKDEL